MVRADPATAARLELEEGATVVVRRRVQYVDGEPYATADTYFPHALVRDSPITEPDDIPQGANRVLDELGHAQVRFQDEITVRMPTADEAAALQIGPWHPRRLPRPRRLRRPRHARPPAQHPAAGRPLHARLRRARRLVPAPTQRLALSVRQATPDDLDTIVDLLREAYDWLIDQWHHRPMGSPLPARSDRHRLSTAAGSTSPPSTTNRSRPSRSPTRPTPNCGTTHPTTPATSAASPSTPTTPATASAPDSSTTPASSSAATGRPWLRLDCAKHNTRLHDYYRAHGFTHLRTIDLPHRESGALF